MALFLAQPGALDPHLAVGLYVRATTTEGWQYRGCVHGAHPSEVMPLQWPHVDAQNVAPGPGVAQVGVSVEPLDELLPREGSKLGAKEQFAKRVGMDLYRFLESFQVGQQYGDQLLIPANALDRCVVRHYLQCGRSVHSCVPRRRKGGGGDTEGQLDRVLLSC